MMDITTRLQLMLGQTIWSNLVATAQVEELTAKVAELERKLAPSAPPAPPPQRP